MNKVFKKNFFVGFLVSQNCSALNQRTGNTFFKKNLHVWDYLVLLFSVLKVKGGNVLENNVI